MLRRILLAAALVSLLAGCDQIPGMGPDPRIAQREEEAKAIGGACRHAQRGLEDCYALNPKANKAAVFTGWKDMDQYMRREQDRGHALGTGQIPRCREARKRDRNRGPGRPRRPKNPDLFPVKYRHALDMGRVWKHVDHARSRAAVARQIHQQPRIAPAQRDCNSHRRCASGRSSARRPQAAARSTLGTAARLLDVGQGLGQCKSAITRGINQPFVGHAVLHQHLRRHLKQIARYKCRSC